jgi:hypothetical protein
MMGYLHVDNLYKSQDILLFKECYALEKIHGTSAHLGFKRSTEGGKLTFFSGGVPHDNFVRLFDQADLLARLMASGAPDAIVYGEAYGGSCQGMSATYGKELKFVVFDVKINDLWLSVPQMADFAASLGLEAVHYAKIPTTLEAIDAQRDAPSIQAARNGIAEQKMREGVVLRPLVELTRNNGDRIIAKHKGEKFEERSTPQKVMDPEKLKVLTEATAIAEEWVTPMRLSHVLDKLPMGPNVGMEHVPIVIRAMQEDVAREAKGEIVTSKEAMRAIGKKSAELLKARLKAGLAEAAGQGDAST